MMSEKEQWVAIIWEQWVAIIFRYDSADDDSCVVEAVYGFDNWVASYEFEQNYPMDDWGNMQQWPKRRCVRFPVMTPGSMISLLDGPREKHS